ncbi:hypothetical protein PPL_05951 [Heterostelium album PN500]|uniref:N-acetylglucosaminylphosphatidylinositol deacetylase n=1 Tax=Heterostelium pallidum (strain ATCC 26659 / Pp 5 / PN500) TaxID=670386 RepID=D3BBT2_HETP5|nr:hypothetical protein PPL_05951 [Heterostelium album PN500]EFA81115.1 hypothetical protein PPL_05951 [Heterostelium album PN500]|eukprot:XP_020433233.1 hypothetical protein PPL_05951 [Heterostelium album PN500]
MGNELKIKNKNEAYEIRSMFTVVTNTLLCHCISCNDKLCGLGNGVGAVAGTVDGAAADQDGLARCQYVVVGHHGAVLGVPRTGKRAAKREAQRKGSLWQCYRSATRLLGAGDTQRNERCQYQLVTAIHSVLLLYIRNGNNTTLDDANGEVSLCTTRTRIDLCIPCAPLRTRQRSTQIRRCRTHPHLSTRDTFWLLSDLNFQFKLEIKLLLVSWLILLIGIILMNNQQQQFNQHHHYQTTNQPHHPNQNQDHQQHQADHHHHHFIIPTTGMARRNVLLAIAHPDDECDAAGLGKIREKELIESCKIYNINHNHVMIVNDSNIRDGMTEVWQPNLIIPHLKTAIQQWDINHILTFDDKGISGHPNHISVYNAVKLFLESSDNTDSSKKSHGITGESLETVNIVRKYIGIADLLVTPIVNRFYSSSSNSSSAKHIRSFTSASLIPFFGKNYQAMQKHETQFVWFRSFSRLHSKVMFRLKAYLKWHHNIYKIMADHNMRNQIILSKIIVQKIIGFVFDSIQDFRDQFKEECKGKNGLVNSNFDRRAVEYSLVCKEWFNIVSKQICTEYLFRVLPRYRGTSNCSIDFVKRSTAILSNPQSIFQIENIQELYFVDHFKEPGVLASDHGGREFISNVELIAYDFGSDEEYENYFDFDFSAIKRWRVDKIFFEYDDGQSGEVHHISYGNLFSIETLKSIEISGADYLDMKDLKPSHFTSSHKLRNQSILQLVSHNFAQSLMSNITLSTLRISCDIVDESFYDLFNNNKNTTITKLKLYNLDADHLLATSKILKSNNTLKNLNVRTYIGYSVEDGKKKDTMKEYIISIDNIETNCKIMLFNAVTHYDSRYHVALQFFEETIKESTLHTELIVQNNPHKNNNNIKIGIKKTK